MSRELLKAVLETKEASAAGVLRGSIKRALGAGAGAGAAVPTLEALGLDQSSPLLWGLVTSAGALGHDLAGAAGKGYSKHLQKVSCARRDKKILLQKLGKCSKGRKKKATMEKPFSKEYSLTKKANLLARAGYVAAETAPTAAGILYGGRMGANLLPENPIIGRLLGALAGHQVSSRATKGLGKSLFPKSHKWWKGLHNEQIAKYSSATKQAGLSRAAKGAIGLPAAALALGPLAAATHMPYVADDMVAQLTGGMGKLDDIRGSLKALYGPLKLPALFEAEGQVLSGNVFPEKTLAGIAGLSALGAGAGKLSEKLVPVAKKSFVEDPKNRRLMLAASLFPWMSTAAGVGYLANRAMKSDS